MKIAFARENILECSLRAIHDGEHDPTTIVPLLSTSFERARQSDSFEDFVLDFVADVFLGAD
jgi:hypothetical protein